MNSSDFRSTARQALTGKWGKVALAFLFYTLIALLFNIIEKNFQDSFLGTIVSIIEIIITVPLGYGLSYSFLKLFNNEDIKSTEFFPLGFNNFGRSWGIAFRVCLKTLLPVILSTACGLILVWYVAKVVLTSWAATMSVTSITNPILSSSEIMLCIIAGIGLFVFSIWAIIKYYLYALSGLISMDHPEMSTKEAVEKSATLMNGNRGKLFSLQLSFIGWAILAFFTLGIGFLWLYPYIIFSTIAFYKYLDGSGNVNTSVNLEDNDDDVIIEN